MFAVSPYISIELVRCISAYLNWLLDAYGKMYSDVVMGCIYVLGILQCYRKKVLEVRCDISRSK